jgi:hypothetical protein
MILPYKAYKDLYKIRSKANIGKQLPFFEELFKDDSWSVNNSLYSYKDSFLAYGSNLFIELDQNLPDINTTFYYSNNSSIPQFLCDKLPLQKSSFIYTMYVNNVVVFNKTNSWSNKFYHFVYDILLKFDILLNQYKDKTLLISLDYPNEQKNILIRLLKENNIQYIEANPNTKYICNNSIALNSPTCLYARATRNQIDFLKKIIYPSKVNKTFKKIYIARKINKDPISGYPQRCILNEQLLFQNLIKHDIAIIYPEDYSINEFHYLMQHAQLVISSHGSQLTNIIFCNENTNILEIMPENYFSKSIACYRAISNILNLDYKYILGCTPEKYLYKGSRFIGNKEVPCSNMVLTNDQINIVSKYLM